MKKTKTSNGAMKKKVANTNDKVSYETPKTAVKTDSLDEEEEGFGRWLKSTEGLETMKLFVIANSIVLLTTLAYPHVQTVFETVSDMIYGADTFY